MTEQEIHDLLMAGERITLECKRARNAVPSSVWETYSAFANTYGGTILLGIDEDLSEKDQSKRFTVTGVEDARKARTDLWNILNNQEKININLLKDEDVGELTIDGKTIVFIRVPQAEYTVRPVFINGNLLRGTFKRNHEGDFHMKMEEIRMLLRDVNDEGNDKLFLEYYTMDDIDMPTLQAYRNHFSSVNPDHVWNNLSPKEFLMQFGCYTIDRKTGKEGLTMAGLLMFGKGLPIRERFSNLRMDYIDKSRLIGDQRYSDRLTYDGTWENNLFNFIQSVLPKLTRELPRPFQMEGIIRKDDTLQHKAVREASTHAIIHADLMLNGLLRVVKYDNRFEFTNPGLLKLPVESIYAGEESRARNQNIQSLLRMIGFGEGLGSGFPLILSAWKEKNWLRPQLFEQPELLQTKLVLNIEQKDETIGGINGGKNENEQKDVTYDVMYDTIRQLSERQRNIFDIIYQNNMVTANDLSRMTGMSERTIRRDLAAMSHIVKHVGDRNNGHWEIMKIGVK